MNVYRTSLRLPATLLLVGQLLYVVVTLLHTGGEGNHHAAIFAAYACGAVCVHDAFPWRFVCLGLCLDTQTASGRWAGRFGGAAAVMSLALYGGVLAVDGVALKQSVNAWANAPEAEKAARFATAEAVRWLEWGIEKL